MNLLCALATNSLMRAKTVVELTLSKYFKREYSSIFRAIDGYYAPRSEKKNSPDKRNKVRSELTDFLHDKALCSNESKYSFYLDMTGRSAKYSPKTPDRSYTYSNGNVGIGHLYSAVCLNAGNGWMLPISMLRVPTANNKFDFAISQVVPILERTSEESLVICVGDAAYCCNKFIHSLNQHENVVTITRVRSNKVIFTKHKDTKKGVGRKKQYGTKYCLSKDKLPEPDYVEQFEEIAKGGKHQTIKISLFKDYICRGSKGYKMSNVPANFLRVEVYKEDGTKKYSRDLWLEVAGKRKDELTPKHAYLEYKDRFDIEHLFKFQKSKLLIDKFQTTDPNKAEDFILFGMIVYHMLYYCQNLLNICSLRKWENKNIPCSKSPWKVFREAAMSNIFDEVDTTAVKKRGIPTEKNIRKTYRISENQPIIRAHNKQPKIEIAIKSRSGKMYMLKIFPLT